MEWSLNRPGENVSRAKQLTVRSKTIFLPRVMAWMPPPQRYRMYHAMVLSIEKEERTSASEVRIIGVDLAKRVF